MESEPRLVDRVREGTLILERSALRDEVEGLERRVSGTFRSGLVITALFVVAGVFMEQTSTLWFLGVMWLLLTLRLVVINRTSGREMRIKEAALESLNSPPQQQIR